jgi:hypothetical protein
MIPRRRHPKILTANVPKGKEVVNVSCIVFDTR